MKVSSPTGGPLTQRRRLSPQSATALLAVALNIFTFTARAQEVQVPETMNRHLRKIAYHYNTSLDFEAAIALIPKAEAYSNNKEQERLWLDIMSGVLHYSIEDSAKSKSAARAASDAAFKRAFERAPDVPLPIKNPSETLVLRFEELRSAHAQEVKARQPSSSQVAPPSTLKPVSVRDLVAKLRELETHAQKWAGGPRPAQLSTAIHGIYAQAVQARSPENRIVLGKTIDTWIRYFKSSNAKGVDDLAAATAPLKPNTPEPATPDLHLGSATRLDPYRSALSADVLHERVRRMREWLVVKSESVSTAQALKILNRLNELHSSLEASETAHERMRIAINLDVLEGQMSIHLGWQIQGSDPKVIPLESD